MNLTPVALPTTPGEVAALAGGSPSLPLAVRIPGHLLAQLDSDTTTALASVRWTFLIGGWSEPILASLPGPSRRIQVERELEALSELGTYRFAGFVADGWEPALAGFFRRFDLGYVFLFWPGPSPLQPVVTDHVGEVVTLFPVGSPICPIVDSTRLAAGSLAGDPVPVEVLATAARPGRIDPVADRGWQPNPDQDPEGTVLYRKMLRLANRLSAKVPPETHEWLLAAQAGHWYRSSIDRTAAHSALATARHHFDLARHRSADWLRMSQLDWDADGRDEYQLETAEISMVVDPEDGTIAYVDHKSAGRCISYIPGEASWQMARVLRDDQPGTLVTPVVASEAGKRTASVKMTAANLELDLTVMGAELGFSYRPQPGFEYDRLGPEITLAWRAGVRVRVDGGDWQNIEQSLPLGGHRFRFEDRSHQILVVLDQPGDLFIRPVAGGTVVWANWMMAASEYRLTLQIKG